MGAEASRARHASLEELTRNLKARLRSAVAAAASLSQAPAPTAALSPRTRRLRDAGWRLPPACCLHRRASLATRSPESGVTVTAIAHAFARELERAPPLHLPWPRLSALPPSLCSHTPRLLPGPASRFSLPDRTCTSPVRIHRACLRLPSSPLAPHTPTPRPPAPPSSGGTSLPHVTHSCRAWGIRHGGGALPPSRTVLCEAGSAVLSARPRAPSSSPLPLTHSLRVRAACARARAGG